MTAMRSRNRRTTGRYGPARERPAGAAALCAALVVSAALSGCEMPKQPGLAATTSQVRLRSFQARAFDTADRIATLRAVMATLQDLGFVPDKADAAVGTISATRFGSTEWGLPFTLVMTVSVHPRGESRLVVRANARYGQNAVEDPQPYQDFFAALRKAMFLDAQPIPAAGEETGKAAASEPAAAPENSPAPQPPR